MHDETLAVHAGRGADPATGAVVPPLYLSTTFERDPGGEYSRGFSYIREDNPTRAAFEAALCALERGGGAIALPSGMAAAYAVVQSLAPGDRIVAGRDLYFGFRDLLADHFPRFGIETEYVDPRDAAALERALARSPKLLWIETPSNPLIEVADIAACARAAHAAGALLVCENSFASPALQQPLVLGADAVVHSVTKYLAGHSDVMGGAVVVKDPQSELARRVRSFQRSAGAVLDPFDAFLALRGMETLFVRMRTHCENAQAIAEFLSAHPAVANVYYPGLASDPGHAVARAQMRGFGGMLSFDVRGERDAAFGVAARLKLIVRATSLGGTHSLIEHRASVEGARTRAPESLLRLSAGIENVRDLIADLDQALAAAC